MKRPTFGSKVSNNFLSNNFLTNKLLTFFSPAILLKSPRQEKSRVIPRLFAVLFVPLPPKQEDLIFW